MRSAQLCSWRMTWLALGLGLGLELALALGLRLGLGLGLCSWRVTVHEIHSPKEPSHGAYVRA